MPLRPARCFAAGILLSVASFLHAQNAQTTASPAPAAAQSAPQDNPDRQHAVELYQNGKLAQAMPLFEKLCSEYPQDAAMWEMSGFTTLAFSQTLSDPDQRRKARVRARTYLVKAKELGDNSNLLQSILPMVPEDGGVGTYSSSKEVNDIMQQAEADFSKGDYDKAKEGYLHTLLLEPTNYNAALFMGDVFYKQHVPGSAGEWYARAIEIDPNRETAYRYWGDALSGQGRNEEAREKYIQAIVADPYNNRSWMGLTQWANRAKVKLNWVKLQDKSSVTATDDSHINITLDPGSTKKDDLTNAAWLVYSGNRALWHGEKFKKEFPQEPNYRRTMREESDSLHGMVSLLTEQKNFEKKKKDLDPTLLQLIEIDQAGFLDPFALLNRADKDIAQDYVPYRAAHRDTIYRYFDEFVVPKAPAP